MSCNTHMMKVSHMRGHDVDDASCSLIMAGYNASLSLRVEDGGVTVSSDTEEVRERDV